MDSVAIGGPSMRECLVHWSLGIVGSVELFGKAAITIAPDALPMSGQWCFEQALAHAASLSSVQHRTTATSSCICKSEITMMIPQTSKHCEASLHSLW